MNTGPESERHSLERVGQALDKVRRVLHDLEQTGHPTGAPPQNVAAGHPTPSTNGSHDQLRAHEAARLLNIPLKEVYAAVRDRRLIATRFGRHLWFNHTDLEAFVRATQRAGHRASATPSAGRARVARDDRDRAEQE